MNRPLLFFSLFFCLGIFCAAEIKIPFLPAYILTAGLFLLCIVCRKKGLPREIIFLCLAFLLGALALINARTLPGCHIAKAIRYRTTNLCTVKGFIHNQPEEKAGELRFIFKTEELRYKGRQQNCCGKILVYAPNISGLRYGERLFITGKLHRPSAKRSSYRNYLFNQGIYLLMRAMSVQKAGQENRGNPLIRLALWLKEQAESILFRYTSSITAGILDAMVLGEKAKVAPLIYKSMMYSGTVHILPRLYTKMPSVAL